MIYYLNKPGSNCTFYSNLSTIETEFKKLFPFVTDPLWISAGKRYFCYFSNKEGLHYVVFSNKGRLLIHLITFHPQNYPLQILEVISTKFSTKEIHLLKKVTTKSQSFYEIVIKNNNNANHFEFFQFKNSPKGLEFFDAVFCITDIIDLKKRSIITNHYSKN